MDTNRYIIYDNEKGREIARLTEEELKMILAIRDADKDKNI